MDKKNIREASYLHFIKYEVCIKIILLPMAAMLLQIPFVWLFSLRSLSKLQNSVASQGKHQSSCHGNINSQQHKTFFSAGA
jgi:hypothetical protein